MGIEKLLKHENFCGEKKIDFEGFLIKIQILRSQKLLQLKKIILIKTEYVLSR